MMAGQILLGHPTANALEIALDAIGDLPLIEGRPSTRRNLAVGLGQIGIAENLALTRCGSGRGIGPLEVFDLFDALIRRSEALVAGFEIVGDGLGHRLALLG